MTFLLLNQAFYPDVAATAQHLADAARHLAAAGHQVRVIASRRAYDDPQTKFPSRETWHGTDIQRVGSTGFGKGTKWKRAADFATFMISCSLKLLFARRPDVVVALTSPPLISFIAACFARLRRCRFVYWVMDLNPDEAIAAGWLREGSLITRLLQRISLFSIRQADALIVLDRFMRDRMLAKGIPAERIHVIAPWSHDDAVKFDPVGRDRFRAKHGLTDKFVVMYSGNHSPCHPLDTLLQAALATCRQQPAGREIPHRASRIAHSEHPKISTLNSQPSTPPIHFCFIGGGSEFGKVQQFAAEHGLTNVTCLPYQPLSELSGSLSAADLHVVVMGNPFRGTIHPCKIYNALTVGAPILYIGPTPSHVTDILEALNGAPWFSVPHDDMAATMNAICELAQSPARLAPAAVRAIDERFSSRALLPHFLRVLESVVSTEQVPAKPSCK